MNARNSDDLDAVNDWLFKRTGIKTWLTKPKKPIGEAKRKRVQWEAAEARAFERLLQIHGCDFFHVTVAQASQPGWPDYSVFGQGWHAFVELKARNRENGRLGKLSAAQYRWKDAIETAGAEWVKFDLPDDWQKVHDWLYSHTGKRTYEVTA